MKTENLTAELNKKVIHQNRALYSLIQKAEQMKAKINFPPSNSKLWDKINTEMENIIPINFPDSLFKKLSTSEISQRFDDWLHQFFLQSFGEKKKSDVMKKRRCPRTNKQLEFLRRRKKECKAAHKALTKAGLTGTAEEQAISKEWFHC